MLKDVAFFEAISESITQLTLSCIILRLFGLSTDPFSSGVQYFTIGTSFSSLYVAFVTVSDFYVS